MIEGKHIHLKPLTDKNATVEYLSWLNSKKINKYLESRHNQYCMSDLKDYIKSTNESNSNFLFGIFTNETNQHIGNIKIGNINKYHHYGDIGLIIGNSDFWGKGIATEAIKLITAYSFTNLNLNKLIAGAYAPNKASIKAFIKAGYQQVAVFRKQVLLDNIYYDIINIDILKEDFFNLNIYDEYRNNNSKRR